MMSFFIKPMEPEEVFEDCFFFLTLFTFSYTGVYVDLGEIKFNYHH